jgi:hypothetical protein
VEDRPETPFDNGDGIVEKHTDHPKASVPPLLKYSISEAWNAEIVLQYHSKFSGKSILPQFPVPISSL